MPSLTTIEGIGEVLARKLKAGGVGSTDALLARGAARKGRRQISQACGIDEGRVRRFVNHVDLMRIRGVGGEFAELLEAAGVDSVPELARRNPANLARTLAVVNGKERLVRVVPSQTRVGGWIAQARKLSRIVTH